MGLVDSGCFFILEHEILESLIHCVLLFHNMEDQVGRERERERGRENKSENLNSLTSVSATVVKYSRERAAEKEKRLYGAEKQTIVNGFAVIVKDIVFSSFLSYFFSLFHVFINLFREP